MGAKRIWIARFNIDSFCREFAALYGNQEHGEFLEGMWRAFSGSPLRGDSSGARASGYEFAQQMLDEAEAFKNQAARAGSLGGTQRAINAGQATLKQPLKREASDPSSELQAIYNPLTTTPPTPPEGGSAEGGKVNGKVNGVSGEEGQKNGKKAPRSPARSKVLLPLTAEPGTALEAFQAARQTYPVKAVGFNERTRNRETRDVGVGSLARAQRYWADITAAGLATDDELYVCSWVARRHWERTEFLWVPNFDTFYGPEKSLWANFIDEAREAIKERDHAISGV